MIPSLTDLTSNLACEVPATFTLPFQLPSLLTEPVPFPNSLYELVKLFAPASVGIVEVSTATSLAFTVIPVPAPTLKVN